MNIHKLALLLILTLAGCAGSPEAPPQTVSQLDLERYQGTWYEMARLPMFFQRKCVAAQADYRLRVDEGVSVVNQCRTAAGEWISAEGVATLQEGQASRLEVRFDNWFSRLFPRLTTGDYWVLYVDDEYQVALVGHPQREYLWLLSREPQLSASQRETLLGVAREQGYVLDELIWREGEAP